MALDRLTISQKTFKGHSSFVFKIKIIVKFENENQVGNRRPKGLMQTCLYSE
jgi:hypothetical protein